MENLVEQIYKTVTENPAEALYACIVTQSNKYVYFNDGTSMKKKEFHQLRVQKQREYAFIRKDALDKYHSIVVSSMKELSDIDAYMDNLQDQVAEREMEAQHMVYQQELAVKTDWEKDYRGEVEKHCKTKDKFTKLACKLYKDLAELPILRTFTHYDGIKFIIQENEDGAFRFCFDPYQIGDNFHSTLSEYYRASGWYTKNGGWMKVVGNEIILYAQSGDYGVYDNKVAKAAVKKLFPEHTIYSFAGKEWSKIPGTIKYDRLMGKNDLPF